MIWPTQSGIFSLGDLALQSGEHIPGARLSWKAHGALSPARDNVIVYPTSYSAQHQIERLQKVFEILGKRAQGVTCEAINGLIEECEELLEEAKQPSAVRDAGLIACGQAVEHYEMARYGSLVAWAKLGGHKDVVALLEQTLAEEKKADTLLNRLAHDDVNRAAKAA
jgi:ferritin-like metal-binding protein YciE